MSTVKFGSACDQEKIVPYICPHLADVGPVMIVGHPVFVGADATVRPGEQRSPPLSPVKFGYAYDQEGIVPYICPDLADVSL